MATVTTGEGEGREGVEVETAEGSSSRSPSNVHSDENGNEGRRNRDNSNVRDQEKFLPIANISRIMKKALPGNAKIAKDAKESMQACVSEFINYVTHEASDKCKREKRKTVNGDDLLWAMSLLGFEESVQSLRIYLDKYRENEGGDKGSTMDKPGGANSENMEGAGPPMSTVVHVGPGSVYGGGMPYILPHMPQTNSHQIDMPPPMMAPGSYQIGMPPPMMGSYQIGMLPPTMEPDNYQMQNQIGMPPPTMEPDNYQMQNQIGMPPPTMEPDNYQMQNQIGMPPPTMEPDNYHLQNQMMGANGNQQLYNML